MTTPEQRAHAAIRREMGGKWFYQRIERNVDVPDIYFKLDGRPGWIELKAAKDNEAVKLRFGQMNWIQKHGHGAMMVVRQLDGRGRHRVWIGIPYTEMAKLRMLHRPTPDSLLACLNCVADASVGAVIRQLM